MPVKVFAWASSLWHARLSMAVNAGNALAATVSANQVLLNLLNDN